MSTGRTVNGDLVFTSIVTGLDDAIDKPTHIAIHREHLFLSYRGGSMQHSATGRPKDWTAIEGASEIATGQEINGMLEGVGAGNLVVLGDNNIEALYGNDAGNWELATHSGEETGAVEWTAQFVGDPIYLDNRGVRSIETTAEYGNFKRGTMTYKVQPWLDAQKRGGRRPISSMRVRAKDQYRLFYETGAVLVVYFGREEPECMFLQWDHKVRCSASTETEIGFERVFFGSDDGWVFEAEKGRSFDGEKIEAFVRLPFNHGKTPTHEKRYYKSDLQVDVRQRSLLHMSATFDYGENPEGSGRRPAFVRWRSALG